jgi:hypothetical protein
MNLLQNKISYAKVFNLKIGVSTGLMNEFSEWEPGLVDSDICIELNNNVLYRGTVTNGTMNFEFDVQDSTTLVDQILKIKLINLANRLSSSVHPMLKIEYVWIEDLCMRKTLEDSGTCVFYQRPTEIGIPSEYMGEPGEQVLTFSTPIYPWLFANEKYTGYYYSR